MVTPLPPVYLDISNVLDSVTETSFDLVVRTPLGTPVYTYGGGRVTVNKPYTDVQLGAVINNAVDSIVRTGNISTPRPVEGSRLTAEMPRPLLLHRDARNRAG